MVIIKVVINKSHSGFELSLKAQKRLAELNGTTIFFYKQIKYEFCDGISEYEREDNLDNDTEYANCVIKDLGKVISETTLIENCYFRDYGYDERHNPFLIQVIKELGDKASGDGADLRIVEIPDDVDYQIEGQDSGFEYISEKHRTWY